MKEDNKMNIIIRNMELKDLDTIIEIEHEAFSTPWSRNAFEVEITENLLAHYLVAVIEEKVVGYAGVWFILDEGHVTNIAVGTKSRGIGVGNKLVECLIDLCNDKGINNMTLEVRKSNTIAQNLYKKYGFIDFGIRPRYYADDNEDAVIMWRTNS